MPSALQQKQQQLLHQQQQHLNADSSSADEQEAAVAAGLQAWGHQQAVELAAAELAQHLSGPLYTLGHQLGLTLCRAVAAATAAAGGSSIVPHDLQESSTAVRFQGFQGLVSLVDLLQAARAEGSQQLAAVAGAVAAGMAAGCLEAAAAAAAGSAGAAAVEDVWASTVAAAAAVNPASSRHQAAAAGHHNHHRHAAAQQHSRRIQQQMRASQQQQQQQQGVVSLQLEPDWVQQLQQQALLLAAAAEAARERCMQPAVSKAVPAAFNAADSAAAVGSAVRSVSLASKLVLGHAYSKLLSGHGHLLQQQQLRQAQNAAGILCSLSYLLNQGCSMSGLFHHAGSCKDAATANRWLAAQQQQHQPHEVGMLVQWLASAAQKLQPQGMLQLLAALRQSAEELAGSYSWYLQAGSKGEVLQGVDAAAARQQLDRLFAVHVALLAALWQQQQQRTSAGPAAAAAAAVAASTAAVQPVLAAEPLAAVPLSSAGAGDLHTGLHAAVAAEGLATLAALQFCQVQLPSYVELLRSLVTAVASSSAAADAFLAAALPCYDSLLQPMLGQAGNWLPPQQQHGEGAAGAERQSYISSSSGPEFSSSSSSSSSTAARAWMANPVLVARLSFVVPLIPLAVKAAADQAAAAAASLPLLLLLVPHPVAAVSQAAHSAVAGLFSTASSSTAADARTTSAARDGQQSESQQQLPLLQQTVEKAVPLYLQRSLDALPGFGSMEGLALGFNSIIRQLPAGSVMALLAVKLVADKAVQLAQQSCEHSSTPQQQQLLLVVSNKVFELVQLALQVVDYALLPSVLQLVSAAVMAAPAAVQRGWLSGLYGNCLAVDDYTRKPGLVTWIDGLARQVALISETQQEAQQQQQHGTSLE
jgi:hypothetical protein